MIPPAAQNGPEAKAAPGRCPAVAVSMGDAAGVGPELCLRALNAGAAQLGCVPIVFGDAELLWRVADICGLPPPERSVVRDDWVREPDVSVPQAVHVPGLEHDAVRAGETLATCGRAAFKYIQAGVSAVLDGPLAALCTAPISKAALHAGGVDYPGHTEMLADMAGVGDDVRMMFVAEKIKVALETIHLPYADVPGRLDGAHLVRTIELMTDLLCRLDVERPEIVVCGLNPHAGEGGLFGTEEREIIEPALRRAAESGRAELCGPLPADTAFRPDVLATADAFLAMYHDQGLIPFKMLAFHSGVNLTLGLPFVRTSPDHGTAHDIAWKGMASAESFFAALRLAARLSPSA